MIKTFMNNITKCVYHNTLSKYFNSKVVKITFDSSHHICYVSLEIVVDNFGLFNTKSYLNNFDGNETCMNISFVAEETFKILLKVMVNGKLFVIIKIY